MSESMNQFVHDWVMTAWSKVFAGQGDGDTALEARKLLLLRYHEVVYHYFVRKLRNEDLARELYSNFAIRLLSSDRLLKHVEPGKGRFRDYLKRCLANMVIDHYRDRAREPLQLGTSSSSQEPVDPADDFSPVWTQELLNQAWKALEQHERTTGQLSYTVLRLQSDNPKIRAADLARQLSSSQGRAYTADAIRQIVHRARKRFSEMLLDEVKRSLGNPSEEELAAELRELGLMEYCKKAMEDRGSNAR
jgi:RNA polymerase sigma factor (sigma-70 family)